MLKKIREEKTFKVNMKTDIKEALQNISIKEDNKEELEEEWLDELIQRRLSEIENMKRNEERALRD